MNTLSISPRADLFRFILPKDFIPAELEDKYSKLLNKDKNVIITPIDYLNESIQGINFPGISNLLIEQDQYSHSGLRGNIIEPARKNITYNTMSPLSQIPQEVDVTFRQNQGLYNYFMIYEIILYKTLKENHKKYFDDFFRIDILSEYGNPVVKIMLDQPMVDGIEGLSFNYNKVERSSETFDVKFKFNNINFEFFN